MSKVGGKVTPLIRLHSFSPFNLTAEEYEKLRLEVEAQYHAGDVTLGTQILAKLLLDNESRYHEVKAILKREAEHE